jgi:hypothetical protein
MKWTYDLYELTDAEFEAVADQVADELTTSLGSKVPPLSDHAVSREGIYEDHMITSYFHSAHK